jgi:hypothetical protein
MASATLSARSPPARNSGSGHTASRMRRLVAQSWRRPVPPSSFTASVRVAGIEQQRVDQGAAAHRLGDAGLAQHVDHLHQRHARAQRAQVAQVVVRHMVDQLQRRGVAARVLLGDGLGVVSEVSRKVSAGALWRTCAAMAAAARR